MGQLVADMVLHDPGFVCLPELRVHLDPSRLAGLPYRLFSGDTLQGGEGGNGALAAGGSCESARVGGGGMRSVCASGLIHRRR